MDDARARQRLTDLWITHQPAVAAFARRRLPPDAVDDVVSETFMVAWRKVDDVPPYERAWLLTITRNVIATRARAYGRWRAIAVRMASEPDDVAPAADDVALDRVHVKWAWARLSDAEREVLALVAWDGLSSHEAAQVLGCLRSTFSVRLTRARRHLLALLDDAPRTPAQPVRSVSHRSFEGDLPR